MAALFNLNIDQGSVFTQEFLVKNKDNSNKDLTGYTARMQFRVSYGSPDVWLEATTLNSKLEINAPASILKIKLSESDTQALMYNKYVYDIEIVDQDNNPTRLVQGNVNVSFEVTK